jgi:hypothetical protein
MEDNKKSNSAKGRESFDITVGNSLVSFFNRNVTPYATEAGGPKFDLVPVTKQKDIMLNVARLHANQEYDRIMELVTVLQNQAAQIRRRLELTDMVHSAKYNFQLYHNQCYWLAFDHRKNYTILCPLGPNDWSTGAPKEWEYITRVKWLGDYTWLEVNPDGSDGTQTL